MKSYLLYAVRFKLGISFEKLLLGHSVLGIARIVHDAVAELINSARIISAAHHLRELRSDDAFKERNMCNIIKIDYASELGTERILFSRRIVAREHDRASDRVRKNKLSLARAVKSESGVPDDLHNIRIRRGLYRKILTETFIPGECILNSLTTCLYSGFVIDMKRCRVIFGDLLDHFFGNKRFLFHK